jgi:hypothetical protein
VRIAGDNCSDGGSSLEKRPEVGDVALWGKQSQEINKTRFYFYNHENIVLVTYTNIKL